MSSNWSFRDLNLEGVDTQKGSTSLKPGRYVAKVVEATLRDAKTGGSKQIMVKLSDTEGQGSVHDFITVWVRNPADEKQATALRIGQERLKALLVYGGHPTPDRPGDLKSLVNLVVGLNVEQGEDWTDDKGVTRKGGGKPKKSGAYFDPAELGYQRPAGTASSGGGDLSDEIPF